MSEEKLRAFIEKVKSDKRLQEKLKAVADPNSIALIAKEAGFEIPAESFAEAQSEVSDKELETIAGGWKLEDGFCTIGFALTCL
ncbi:MAG: hypothetical protein CBC48_20590 [bacterium TMED88]|nr:lantipeptide [Deltaproteobacteria bacterium]OUV21258.1 MAG: hypothetical protein CBC48_20590 [bacterium TMED88]